VNASHGASVPIRSPLSRYDRLWKKQIAYLSDCFNNKGRLVHPIFDDRAQELLLDQRQQLAEVTAVADFDTWRDNLVAAQRRGEISCVLGRMRAQIADGDEGARMQVASYFAEWRRLVISTLLRMQADGQLRSDADVDELATGLIAAVNGGHVRAQASGNVEHMATAIQMALGRIRFFADVE
jgi:TetR/AcrR family transcriptional repressor of nem operon